MQTATNTTADAGTLKGKALLVSVTIKQWSPNRKDKAVTAEVAADKAANANRIRVNKTLVACDELDTVKRIGGEIRKLHYEYTAAWGEKMRIMPTAKFRKFSDEIRAKQVLFDAAADAFEAVYPEKVRESQQELIGLGHAFDPDDYPSPSEVRAAFSVSWEFGNLSDAPDGDFRVTLSDDDRAAIEASMQAQFQANAVAAMADTYRRVQDTLEALSNMLTHTRTNKKGETVPGKITRTVIERAVALADDLPAFNLTDDSRIPALVAALRDNLAGMDSADEIEAIKKDPEAREAAAEQAQAVLDLMRNFQGGEAAPQETATDNGELW
jgi:hypothetical protein